jgi:hypothetical protein
MQHRFPFARIFSLQIISLGKYDGLEKVTQVL